MSLNGKRIYIIEDNPDNIHVLLKLLDKHGAKVLVDWWAKGEGQRVLTSLPIDLIILDLMLPNQRSGFDVFDELRQLPQLAKVPIIAVSAAEVSFAVPLAKSKGFSGFISKPIDFELFPKQIAAVINGEQVWHFD